MEQALIDWLQANVGGRWVIAGGYARDKILGRKHRDIDVFGLGMKGRYKDVAHRLKLVNTPYTVEPKAYGFPGHSGIELHNRFDPAIHLNWMGEDVHLVCTPMEIPEDVVETFDFNICRFWLDPGDLGRICERHLGDKNNLYARNMRVCHTRTPASSLRRGYLFEYRLGFKFQPSDVRALVESLAEKGVYDI